MANELGSPLTVGDARPAAVAAVEVFDLDFEELPAEDGAGLWPQHPRLHGRPMTGWGIIPSIRVADIAHPRLLRRPTRLLRRG